MRGSCSNLGIGFFGWTIVDVDVLDERVEWKVISTSEATVFSLMTTKLLLSCFDSVNRSQLLNPRGFCSKAGHVR